MMKNKIKQITKLVCLLGLLPKLVFAAPIKLTDVDISNGFFFGTSVKLTLSQPTKYHVYTLEHPNRLVIDLSNTYSSVAMKKVSVGNSVFQSIRSGHPDGSTLRIVLDLKSPIKFKDNADPYKIVVKVDPQKIVATNPIEVKPVETKLAETKKAAAQVESKPEAKPDTKPAVTVGSKQEEKSTEDSAGLKTSDEKIQTYEEAKKSVENQKISTTKVAAETKITAANTISKPATIVAKNNAHSTIVVAIDPGHGGKDTGAIGKSGTKEKDVVLAIARRLANIINRQPHMHAVLTRSGDYYVPLRGRTKLARKGKADLFIAIHADSYFDSKQAGISIYALSHNGATTEAARWLARRENTSELGGVDLGELGDKSYVLRSVLIDLAQTATITDSLRLGKSMLDSLDDVAELHYSRVEQAPFMVLKSPDIPSILVETGFISNPTEEEKLKNLKYQNKIAQALYSGVQIYIKKYMR